MDSQKPEFHVPGAYYDSIKSVHRSSQPSRVLGADVFLPPADLAPSTGSLFSDMSTAASATNNPDFGGFTAKRKRPAQDFSRESTPAAGEYTLAGQIDVDGTQSSRGLDESAYYSDIEYRRQLGPSQDAYNTNGAGTAGERWTVLHALGSVVGKVWSFCTASAFRGFKAGGGTSYDWETGKPTGLADASNASGGAQETDGDANLQFEFSSPGPSSLDMGGFNFDGGRTSVGTGGIPDRKVFSGTPPPRRNGKRRQIGPSGDELNRNWVMVDCSRSGNGGRASRARSSSSATMSTLNNSLGMAGRRTPDRRISQFRTTKSAAATPVTAASSRPIHTPISQVVAPSSLTPSRTPSRRQQRTSLAGSPSLSLREPASFASPRVSTPLMSRRATLAGAVRTSYSPGSGSRIPVPSTDNPFSRMASTSSRPSSSLGFRSGSTMGQRPGSALGQRPGSAMAQRPGSAMSQSPGHRRSNSARVGLDGTGRERQKSPKKMGGLGTFEQSPRLTEEAKRLATKKLVAERDADAKMEALNHQLQMMIRQGREALGTTFEVDVGEGDEGDDGDEVWADDL